MILGDKNKFIGEATIKIFRKGKQIRVWQEYGFLHKLRKRYGVNFPKIPFVFGYYTKAATYKNLVVNSGRALIAGRIYGTGNPTAPTTMAIGTGTSPVAATNTTLETEITTGGGARATGTATLQTKNVTNDTCQLVRSWTLTQPFGVTEMGIFNSANTMLVRMVFPVYSMQANDTFEITHRIVNTSA